ncbi:uncharacterized protein LOC142230516 isoform X2 [Haematobia irritans]|uniref:uncharacterized protein LOC142230516 isoform X2 n=1 Tax=Haematobia irritans TaxID=7368 RepID=UPI003F50262F
MAAFVAPEDLEKLKKFIDFVAANPLILNTPQLGFLKRFVEKLGGKVPEGEFQMPAGGKCPFGGDAKSETKPSPPTQPEEGDVPVVEEESEESEVELDMEEINVKLLEPNVLYIDEKPPIIVKQAKGSKKMAKKKPKIEKRKLRKTKKKIKTGSNVAIKTESYSTINEEVPAVQEAPADQGVDPLYTSTRQIKKENDTSMEDNVDVKSFDQEMSDGDELKIENCDNDDENEFLDMYETKIERVEQPYDDEGEQSEDDDYGGDDDEYSNSDGEDDDDDEEPLIMIANRKGRKHKKIPRMEQCRDACKQKCNQKFTQEQRRAICELYWSLCEEEKKQFIRQRTKTKLKRYQRVKSRNTKSIGHYCYYLDDAENKNLIRVCRKYFESTLCTTNYTIKKALDGYEPEIEVPNIKRSVPQQKKVGSEDKSENDEEENEGIRQYLDPETGDLITIDPKAEKLKKAIGGNSGADGSTPADGTKKKSKPRKRGVPPPPVEHSPKPIKCQERCIYKCHTKFSEEERKQICDVFWSMDYKRRKDFVLSRIETKDIEVQTTPEFRKSNRPPRAYHTRFFLRSGLQGENIRVCKHFMMNTLAISRMFITNAIDFADKTTGHYTGLDRRGLNSAANKIGPERLKLIKDQIGSFPTWIPSKKSKTRYLHHSLSIKRMYLQYKELCIARGEKFVSTNIYYKTFHDDFRLSFLSSPLPSRAGGFLKSNPNISHYTGEEPGGMWLDPYGEKLDLSLYNPAQSFINMPPRVQQAQQPQTQTQTQLSLSPASNVPTTASPVPLASEESLSTQPPSSQLAFNQPFNYAHLIDSTLNHPNLICQPSATTTTLQQDFNLNIYEGNLPHAHAASTSSIFRRL